MGIHMNITYIGHSGYLVELAQCCCLFDYYVGELPHLPENKEMFVFVSHHHPDHYNPDIYQLAEQYQRIHYILPKDVKLSNGRIPLLNAEQIQELKEQGSCRNFIRMKAGECRQLEWVTKDASVIKEMNMENTMTIEAFRSTDCGVAYLVTVGEDCIFHAGDLNWWAWNEENAQYNNNVAANYKREIDKLQGKSIQAAFLPIDPRQKECYWYGYDYFIKTVKPEKVFPMHFMEDTKIVERFLQEAAQRKETEFYSKSWLFQPLAKGECVSCEKGEIFCLAGMREHEKILALYHSMLGMPGCTWSEEYPNAEILAEDIENNMTFIMKHSAGELMGTISAEESEEEENHPAWNSTAKRPVGMARLAVAKKYQNQGLAKRMILAVMNQMRARGYDAARYLVSPGNAIARAAYEPLHFEQRGNAHFYEEDWLLYEKQL